MSVDGSTLEAAVKNALVSTGKFLAVEVGRPLVVIGKPGVSVAVEEGDFEPQGNALRQSFVISVLVAAKNSVSESERRKAVHPLQAYVARLLWGETLSLPINGIQPGRWTEITTAEQLKDGVIVIDCRFTTKAVFTKAASEEEKTALDEIWASYEIQSGTEAASDHLVVEQP
ncbi:MAG TPA: hypothetical protein PKY05_03320 [Fibrobacteria bacterium]|nr:hypothetical protein [Fibrobacteria bacterium]